MLLAARNAWYRFASCSCDADDVLQELECLDKYLRLFPFTAAPGSERSVAPQFRYGDSVSCRALLIVPHSAAVGLRVCSDL